MNKSLFFTLLIFLISGCATQRKTHIADRIFDLFEDYTKVITDAQIRRSATERPELPKDAKIAVYFKEADPKSKSPQEWKWSQGDKEQVMNAMKNSPGNKGKIFELINTGAKSDDAKSLRLMASQQGADALLLVQGLSEVSTESNGLALSYIAVLPALFINGNTVEGTFITQALLWNVEQPYVHVGVQSEGDYKHKRPIAFRQIHRVIKKSKEDSLNGLTQKLQREFAQI